MQATGENPQPRSQSNCAKMASQTLTLMPAFSWELDKLKRRNPSDDWRKMTSRSNFVALIYASKWQKKNLQLQINPRIMNEGFSPGVLIEYFLPDSLCWQWWMFPRKQKKEGSSQNRYSYSTVPTSDFSCAWLLIGSWWVFIEQLNWMMFDT